MAPPRSGMAERCRSDGTISSSNATNGSPSACATRSAAAPIAEVTSVDLSVMWASSASRSGTRPGVPDVSARRRKTTAAAHPHTSATARTAIRWNNPTASPGLIRASTRPNSNSVATNVAAKAIPSARLGAVSCANRDGDRFHIMGRTHIDLAGLRLRQPSNPALARRRFPVSVYGGGL